MSLIRAISDTAVNYIGERAAGFLSKYSNKPDNTENNAIEDREEWWQPVAGFNFYDKPSSKYWYRSFAFAAINKGAINFAKGKPYVYREQKGGKRVEIEDHPFLRVLKRLNIYKQSFPEICAFLFTDMKGYGNAYLHIPIIKLPFPDTLGNKMVSDIIPLSAKNMTPVMNTQGTLIEYYEYTSGSTKTRYEIDEIIHFKYTNPDNPLTGLAPASRFNFTLELDYDQAKFTKGILKNSAKISGFLTTPGPVPPEKKRELEDKVNGQASQAAEAGKSVVITGGMKYIPSQHSPKELEYQQSRLNIRDEILVILDVPKTVMNISDDVNYSNSKAALRSFIENNIQPFANTYIIPQINAHCKAIYGDRFLFNMEWEFDTDREMQLSTLKFYSDSGKFTDNEIREIEGYESVNDPRADTIYRQDFIQETNPKEDEEQPTAAEE